MAVNPFFMALMPISHIASWYLLLNSLETSEEFHMSVAMVAAFYCLWALYKVHVEKNKKELGHMSMGILTVACVILSKRFPHLVMTATIMVIVNFAVVLPFFANRGVEGVVKMVHKEVNSLSMMWGYIFFTYILSNVVMWCWVLKTLIVFRWGGSRSVLDEKDEIPMIKF